MSEKHLHKAHPDVIKRLKRAHGHLLNVIAMIEKERACIDIAQQLYAVERAISAAKSWLFTIIWITVLKLSQRLALPPYALLLQSSRTSRSICKCEVPLGLFCRC